MPNLRNPGFTKKRTVFVNLLSREQYIVDADNMENVVSKYPSVDDTTETDKANAFLDVAAPDLYAACFAFVDAYILDDEEDQEKAFIDMQRALAKARGEV